MILPFEMKYSVLGLIITCFLFCSCQQKKQQIIDRSAVLRAYAREFIDEKDEYIYYRSKQEVEKFKEFIGLPFSLQRVKKITKPVSEINLDSLLSSKAIEVWNKKLSNYKSIVWNQDILQNLPFISDNKIPDFFYEGGIPLEEDRVVDIYFVSTPIIYKNVALIIYSVRTSPMIGSTGYLIFAKINGRWQIVANDVVVWAS